MSQLPSPYASSYGAVLRALEGFRNFHAMRVMLGGFLLVGLVGGLGFGSGNIGLGALLSFVAVLLALSAVNAAGLALMDTARGQPARGFLPLLIAGAICFIKFLGIGIIAFLGFLAYMLVLAVLLYLCKIPFLGPLLLVVLLPLMILVTALVILALFISFSLVAPALWEGNSISSAFSRLIAIAGQRPLEVVVSLILLSLLTGVVAAVVGIFVFSGTMNVGGLAVSILGGNVLGAIQHMSMGGLGGYGAYGEMGGFRSTAPAAGAGLMVAGATGLAIVTALVSGVLAAIQLNGLCHIYLQASEGADDARAREGLDKSISQTKEIFGRAGAKMAGAARDFTARVEEISKSATAHKAAGSREPADTRTCPSCQAPVSATDSFCGECGTKL